MPTTDIPGYLASRRQELDLCTTADIRQMASDRQRSGLDVLRTADLKIFGVPTGVSVQWVRMEEAEWDELVHAAVVSASVAQMTSRGEHE